MYSFYPSGRCACVGVRNSLGKKCFSKHHQFENCNTTKFLALWLSFNKILQEQKQTKISPLLKAAARVGYSSSRVRKPKKIENGEFWDHPLIRFRRKIKLIQAKNRKLSKTKENALDTQQYFIPPYNLLPPTSGRRPQTPVRLEQAPVRFASSARLASDR